MKIFKISILLTITLLIFYIFYFFQIRPYITGNFKVTESDCKKATNCVCLKNSCNCNLKKWFKTNRIVCNKSEINTIDK